MTPEREQELADQHARSVRWIRQLEEEKQSTIDFWREADDPVRATVEESLYNRRIANATARKDLIINILAGKEPDDGLI